jgi:hypothetical protein
MVLKFARKLRLSVILVLVVFASLGPVSSSPGSDGEVTAASAIHHHSSAPTAWHCVDQHCPMEQNCCDMAHCLAAIPAAGASIPVLVGKAPLERPHPRIGSSNAIAQLDRPPRFS